jgi:HPr kinase/phosphorylase
MSLPESMHASAVLLRETGILIRGASGSGKSSIAHDLLRANPDTAHLVADDRVIVSVLHGRIIADAPASLAGLLEVRGLGLVKLPYIAPVVIRLIVDLVAPEKCERMPGEVEARAQIHGILLPRLFLPIGGAWARNRIDAAIDQFSACD